MPLRIGIELDIFSGMPNPTWVLTKAEADTFAKQLATLPPTTPSQLSVNLGYRGFIVQITQEAATQSIHIQKGIVHISKGAGTVYAHDEARTLERWLLDTGKPHVKDDVFQAAQRGIMQP